MNEKKEENIMSSQRFHASVAASRRNYSFYADWKMKNITKLSSVLIAMNQFFISDDSMERK